MRRFWVVGGAALLCAVGPVRAWADPVRVLFVGNSFTHGRYDPARNDNSGFDSGPGAAAGPHVHDLLCPTAATCSAAESVAPTDPDTGAYPPLAFTLRQKLDFLAATPSAQYAEAGPFGGVPGVFLQLARDAGLDYDVSILAVSAATLAGKSLDGSAANSALIGSARWDRVVLQDQSFEPLPPAVVVDGRSVATRGDPAAFQAGVDGLVGKIDAADAAAGRAPVPVTLYETPPMASYGYASARADAPVYGSSASAPGGPNAPYVGAANPVAQMAGDLHRAYGAAAAQWNAANPGKSRLDVAPVGDAWVSAMNMRVAQADPFLPVEPGGTVDLWDGDALLACCTAPIGYHPSAYGAYLDALVLFAKVTGHSPLVGGGGQAARMLGVAPAVALGLQLAAAATIAAGGPVAAVPWTWAQR